MLELIEFLELIEEARRRLLTFANEGEGLSRRVSAKELGLDPLICKECRYNYGDSCEAPIDERLRRRCTYSLDAWMRILDSREEEVLKRLRELAEI